MNKRVFILRRLHSFMGVLPGLFLLEHLITNSFALKGAESFNEKVNFFSTIPYLPLIEIFFIGLPIAFHAIYGMYVVYVARNNVLSYNYFRNWMFYLQRVTAVITLIFVVWHVFDLRLAKTFFDLEISFETMNASLSNPLTLAFYMIGLVSAIFHFANGLWTLFITWGVTVGPRAQRISTYLAVLAFMVLNIVGINALLAFVR